MSANSVIVLTNFILTLVAIFSAIYAGKQAKSAREQAETAKEANKILRTEMKRRIINECVAFYERHGEWKTYLDSTLDLSNEERDEINEQVRKRLKKE
ncbi:MAG: hypothetical protein ACTSR3_18260 [Candidatus Helarchaeota archaeon]